MKVIVTEHARTRLNEDRQRGIEISDVVNAALKVPGKVPTAARFRGFSSENGRIFDIVIKDIGIGRLVITVIGK